jgi:hypothetical protein
MVSVQMLYCLFYAKHYHFYSETCRFNNGFVQQSNIQFESWLGFKAATSLHWSYGKILGPEQVFIPLRLKSKGLVRG